MNSNPVVGFLALVLAFFIFLHPNRQIAHVQKVRLPWKLPQLVQPGQVLLLKADPRAKNIHLHDRPMTYIPFRHSWLGVISSDHLANAMLYGEIETGSHTRWPWFIHPRKNYFAHLLPIDLPSQLKAPRLQLSKKTWNKVNGRHAEQKKKDRLLMKKLLSQSNFPLDQDCWLPPIHSQRTSRFAAPRTLPNGKTYLHTGVDLRARKGTPIHAVANGRVIFSGHLVVPGNAVVIDHGGGLFSRYFHLSQPLVHSGDQVKTGDVIGNSGATGRVEAPHLHWEIIWKRIPANPFAFLKAWEPFCDPSSVAQIEPKIDPSNH